MQTYKDIAKLRSAIQGEKSAGKSVAFVPTMGNLHDGHLKLVQQARASCDCVVVSIFINPLQFGPREDLQNYPRTFAADKASLAAEGVTFLFAPEVEAMYPQGQENQTIVRVPKLADQLCGAYRPGHFTGVTSVVAKLINIVTPDIAVFGEKDYQQLTVIRQMCRDLSLPVEIIAVPTARAPDGLALSSRNSYLTTVERRTAPKLQQILLQLKDDLLQQRMAVQSLEHEGRDSLKHAGFDPEYVAIRDAETLNAVDNDSKEAVILAAARLGKTRLIDNVKILLRGV